MENILIASLGESPIVVTAMVKFLAEREHLDFDRIILLYPKEKYSRETHKLEDGIELIEGHCFCRKIEPWGLPFVDANTSEFCHEFLQTLYGLLETAYYQEDAVYLSLAGGRKSMSALMGLLAPFYQNIKKLYHILDKNEDDNDHRNFYTLSELDDLYYKGDPRLEEIMNPPIANLNLIEIPFAHFAEAEELRKVLQHDDSDNEREGVRISLDAINPDVKIFWKSIFQKKEHPVIDGLIIRFSQIAYEQYQRFGDNVQKNFLKYFRFMKSPEAIKEKIHGTFSGQGAVFHFFKLRKSPERPLFYQQDNQIIIAQLTHKTDNSYQELSKKLSDGDYIPLMSEYEPKYTLGDLEQTGDILLASIGKSPMVATQAYTLFQRQGVNIDKVALVFPERNGTIANGIRLLESVFESKNVTVKRYGVALSDVASKKDCEIYLETLVKTIDELRTLYPDSDIKLLLSGGRKGMTALSLFAAQRSGITQVYHTLINDPEIEERIERESSIEQLNALGSTSRKAAIMFLDEYAEQIKQFTLFKIPVIPFKF